MVLQQTERFDTSSNNISHTKTGRAVYGLLDSPAKKVLKFDFENQKALDRDKPYKRHLAKGACNIRNQSSIFEKGDGITHKNGVSSRGCSQTFCSSPDNPLKTSSEISSNGNTKYMSNRYAARRAFEEARSKNKPEVDKYADQRKATEFVKNNKVKEHVVLQKYPHGATKLMVHTTQPEGLSLPGLGFGGVIADDASTKS